MYHKYYTILQLHCYYFITRGICSDNLYNIHVFGKGIMKGGGEQLLSYIIMFLYNYMHFMDIVIHWMVRLARTNLNSRLFLICICNNYNIGNLTFTFLHTKSSKCV